MSLSRFLTGKLNSFNKETKELKDKLENYDDKSLVQMTRSGPAAHKLAAGQILRDRGYKL